MTWTASSLRAPTARKRTPARRRRASRAARGLEVQATGGAVLQAYRRRWRRPGRSAIGACAARACPGRPGQRPWPRTGSAPIVARRRASPRWTDGAVPAAQLLKPLRAHALPYMGPLPRPTWITTRCAVCTRWRPFPPPAPASISRWPQAGHLEVLSAAGQGGQPVSGVVQVYRALNSNSAYTRSLVGENWTPWKKIATTEDINEASGSYATHVRLAGAGVDLNRCYLGESYYTWDAGETMTAGLNFRPPRPPPACSTVASTGRVLQTVLLDAGPAARPACTRVPGMARPAPGAHGESRAASAASPSCRRRMRARYM